MRKLEVIKIENDLVQKVELQTGCNSISRTIGPGCDNKQIIQHALTINVSPGGEMTITPYQVSPCYVKLHGACKWQLVKLGTTVPIEPGDICSLLHDRCWLKIIDSAVMEENDNTLKRKVAEEIEETSNKRICSLSSKNILSSDNDNLTGSPSRNDVDNSNASEVPLLKDVSEHNVEQDHDLNTQSQPPSTCLERVDFNEGIEEQNEEIPVTIKESSPANNEVASNGNLELDITSDVNDPTKLDVNLNQSPPREQNQVTLNRVDNTQVIRRNKCAYHDKCYRKSKDHRTQFSHPGDSDYDAPDDRPECSYGVRCYRKNLQHRAKYKHSSLRQLRRKNVVKQKKTSDAELCDDDESSAEESIDESEYEPTDYSDSSDDDDNVKDATDDANENDSDNDDDDDDEYYD